MSTNGWYIKYIVGAAFAWVLACGVAQEAVSKPDSAEKAAQEVKAVLEGPWTELRIASVLLTDYGSVFAVAVEVVRAQEGGPMQIREMAKPERNFRPLTKVQFLQLIKVLEKSGAEVENERTDAERFGELVEETSSNMTQEERVMLWKKKQLPKAWDVQMLIIRSNAASGPSKFNGGGRAVSLELHLDTAFSVKARELSFEEVTLVLGENPYDKLNRLSDR